MTETMRSGSKLVYQYESADPVEDLHFPVNGIRMTNFVYPTYFEEFHKPGSVKFDHLNALNKLQSGVIRLNPQLAA